MIGCTWDGGGTVVPSLLLATDRPDLESALALGVRPGGFRLLGCGWLRVYGPLPEGAPWEEVTKATHSQGAPQPSQGPQAWAQGKAPASVMGWAHRQHPQSEDPAETVAADGLAQPPMA